MDVKVKTWLKYSLSLVFAAVLLYFAFRGVKWADFADGLRGCRWVFIALSMLCGVTAFVFRALRWRRMLHPLDAGLGRLTVYDAVCIGNISNFIFPFLGEFVRCGVVSRDSSRRGGAKYESVLGTVALERLWDMLTVALVLLVVLSAKWEMFGAFFIDRIWHPVTGRFGAAAWIAAGAVVVALAVFVLCIFRFRERVPLLGRIAGGISGICRGVAGCFRMKGWHLFAVDTLVIWVMYWLMIVFVIEAFPAVTGLTPLDALFISMTGSIASFVPVPGGMGAFHYLVALALSVLYGFPWEVGIVFATLAHESQALTMALTGGISFLHDSLKK